MRLQGAIFDMDGTLLDSMHAWRALGTDLLRKLGREPEPDLDRKLGPMSLKDGAAYCRERYGLSLSEEAFRDEMMAVMDEFYRNHVRPRPGVERVLSLLKMEGVKMYVATATDRPLAEVAMERTGLTKYFQGLITCREAGAGKRESPIVYEKALRRLQTTKEGTMVFEDALYAIRTAKAAGFRVVGICDPSEPDQAAVEAESDYYIRTFEEWTELNSI